MEKSTTEKVENTTTEKNVKNNTEIEELRASFAELKAQNELLMKMLMEKNNQTPTTSALNNEYTIIHLVEREDGLTTHIELSNVVIDMTTFGEERLLDRRQCDELVGSYRRFFNKGIIAFGADGEEIAKKFGLNCIKDYSYMNNNFVKQLGNLSLIDLENLYNKVCDGHKAFIIEYFKRQIVKNNPAFKNIHKIELLNRLSDGAMNGTALDLKREKEQAESKK